jgi:hypothetical protein
MSKAKFSVLVAGLFQLHQQSFLLRSFVVGHCLTGMWKKWDVKEK